MAPCGAPGAEGVNVLPKTAVTDIQGRDKGRVALTLDNGEELVVDHVVVAVGIEPNVELAECVQARAEQGCADGAGSD